MKRCAGQRARFRAAKARPPVCNLYSLNKKRDAVARFFRVSHNHTVAFEPLSAIFPGHVAPVVRQSADGDREIVTMSPWRCRSLNSGRRCGRCLVFCICSHAGYASVIWITRKIVS